MSRLCKCAPLALGLWLIAAMGCARDGEAPQASAPSAGVKPATPISTPPAGQEPILVQPSGGDPQSLYQSCLSRVEGRGKPGECTTDADCTKAGCSQEMCIARAEAAGVMSTCEVRPCFAVLDSCGCQAGQCTWSLKSEAPVIPTNRAVELPQ